MIPNRLVTVPMTRVICHTLVSSLNLVICDAQSPNERIENRGLEGEGVIRPLTSKSGSFKFLQVKVEFSTC